MSDVHIDWHQKEKIDEKIKINDDLGVVGDDGYDLIVFCTWLTKKFLRSNLKPLYVGGLIRMGDSIENIFDYLL